MPCSKKVSDSNPKRLEVDVEKSKADAKEQKKFYKKEELKFKIKVFKLNFKF